MTPEINGTFRLTNQAQGETLSLDIINDGKANNAPILAKKALVSGQLWKVSPVSPCP
ncbi:hypothetical protein [Archangium lansingense]|uniref:Uncharacterized protein n=1 Tax=Archangium lansingense TaxID=2995310 RepID=A0ABT4A8N7_9BACT|nr:hypothetical protein [Archangium lansinium]MCY1077334.1 hypothetical protein [Archangium lansinium]